MSALEMSPMCVFVIQIQYMFLPVSLAQKVSIVSMTGMVGVYLLS